LSESVQVFFIVCLFLYCPWRSNYQKRGGWWWGIGIPLTVLIPPNLCICPKTGHGYPMLYVMVYFCVQCFVVRSWIW